MKNFIVNASRKVWQELIQNVNHYSYSLDSTVIVKRLIYKSIGIRSTSL